VYGVGGSGFITPHLAATPVASRMNSPRHGLADEYGHHQHASGHVPTHAEGIEGVL
jgi:hypothetical protein